MNFTFTNIREPKWLKHMKTTCREAPTRITSSSKFNRFLNSYWLASYLSFWLIKIFYKFDANKLTMTKAVFFKANTNDDLFLKLFEHYFFHQCNIQKFKEAYFLKFVIINSLYNHDLKSINISQHSLHIWNLLFRSTEFQMFIGQPISNTRPILHDSTKVEFLKLIPKTSPPSEKALPSTDLFKILGPLDDIDLEISKYNNFICLKPYTTDQLTHKFGVFLPNNYTLNNRANDCRVFQDKNINFLTIIDVNQLDVNKISDFTATFQMILCGSSLMGLQKALLAAYKIGLRKVNCEGFDFSLGDKKYVSSYPSSFHGSQKLDTLIKKSNFQHDLLFNFLFTKIATDAFFEECTGQIRQIVDLDVNEFLTIFAKR